MASARCGSSVENDKFECQTPLAELVDVSPPNELIGRTLCSGDGLAVLRWQIGQL